MEKKFMLDKSIKKVRKMKNIDYSKVLNTLDLVPYLEGQVVSKTLVQNGHISITLFSFDKGEEISTHKSDGDAFVTCLDGLGKITIDGEEHLIKTGESIVMPSSIPHAVYAESKFKMMLVVVF